MVLMFINFHPVTYSALICCRYCWFLSMCCNDLNCKLFVLFQVERNILATNPRVTRFKIDWDDTPGTDSENVPPTNSTESESNQMKEGATAGGSKPLASAFSTESNSNMEVNWPGSKVVGHLYNHGSTHRSEFRLQQLINIWTSYCLCFISF